VNSIRVLYRHFLFRIVDLDALAPLADTHKLLGRVAFVLVMLSLTFVVQAFTLGSISNLPAQVGLVLAWAGEHFLIATTMLVTGILAVLSWDSTFPTKRDLDVLGPLPVLPSAIFAAKAAAVGSALGLVILLLHAIPGLIWPAVLHSMSKEQPVLALTYGPRIPVPDIDRLKPVLDRSLADALRPGGALGTESNGGLVIGVADRGQRRVFAYGSAKPETIFPIASVSKTFTALMLARMATDRRTSLNEPLRALLPPGTVARPGGAEITLLDLALHRSGLPAMPDNLKIASRDGPAIDYGIGKLFSFIGGHGVSKRGTPAFDYSNVGYALLGQALAQRQGVSYEELLRREITDPLGMRDTGVAVNDSNRERIIPGRRLRGGTAKPVALDSLTPAGGILSTAGDLLNYIEAQLKPDAAIALSHRLRADMAPGYKMGLGWIHSSAHGVYWHNGGLPGYSSYVFFHPGRGFGGVVLLNQGPEFGTLGDLLGDHLRARLAGEPAVSLDSVTIPAPGGFTGVLRYAAAYWITMICGGAFVFFAILAVQGLAMQLLPWPWFLKASSVMQLTILCILLGGSLLQPALPGPHVLVRALNEGPLYWSPSYWFLGVFQQLAGSPALAPLAWRAWTALAAVLLIVAVSYLLSYWRTLRKMAEAPDIVPGGKRRHWLPRFGSPLATAVAQFSIRTLMRSRQHRLILAFYWGIAFTIVLLVTKSPAIQKRLGAGDNVWTEPNVAAILASVLVCWFAVLGARMAAVLPIALPANWIFRASPVPGGVRTLAVVRRALYAMGPVQVWRVFALLFLSTWPWRAAAGHLVLLALLTALAAEVSLLKFGKIPFTCSYLPGEGRSPLVFFVYLFGMLYQTQVSALHLWLLENPVWLAVAAGVLLMVIAGVYWWNRRKAEVNVEFEDEPQRTIVALDLSRDGTPLR